MSNNKFKELFNVAGFMLAKDVQHLLNVLLRPNLH
jgi:hypothetical protein